MVRRSILSGRKVFNSVREVFLSGGKVTFSERWSI